MIELRNAINEKVIIMNEQIETLNIKLAAVSKMTEITPDSDFVKIIRQIVNSILINDESLSNRIVNEISTGIQKKLSELERKGKLTISR